MLYFPQYRPAKQNINFFLDKNLRRAENLKCCENICALRDFDATHSTNILKINI